MRGGTGWVWVYDFCIQMVHQWFFAVVYLHILRGLFLWELYFYTVYKFWIIGVVLFILLMGSRIFRSCITFGGRCLIGAATVISSVVFRGANILEMTSFYGFGGGFSLWQPYNSGKCLLYILLFLFIILILTYLQYCLIT